MKCKCGIKIIDHPAKACLDAMFAEVVMGWVKIPETRWWIDTKTGLKRSYFKPSRNIGHAMEGVEKAQAEGATIRMSNKVFKEWWWCYVDDFISQAETLELGITRAHILWAGEKGKK